MNAIRYGKKAAAVLYTLGLFLFMISVSGKIYAENSSDAVSPFEARIIEEELAREKRVEKKTTLSELSKEVKTNYEAKDYETTKQLCEKILQIDPNNKNANRYIRLCDEAASYDLPNTVCGSLIKRGKINYKNKEYAAAISDFEMALTSNPNDGEARQWLAKSQEALANDKMERSKAPSFNNDGKTGKEEEGNYGQIRRQRQLAKKEKDDAEQAMLLEVDQGWLPPKRLPREEMEIEEIVSPEELVEQEAKKKLEEKMAIVVVPALSVTDADVQDLIHQLMELTGVTIVLDERALSELTKEQPIKISIVTVNPVPLLDVLNIAFKPTQLGYKVEANYVWVSSKVNVAKEELVTRTYRLKYGVRQTRKVELEKLETSK